MSEHDVMFELLLEDKLNEALEETDLALIAKELLDTINDTELKLRDSKMQLSHLIERINSALGIEIRKRQPRMTISHSNGACTCGYKARDLTFKPDLTNKLWKISGRLGRGFVKEFPHRTRLDADLGSLADCIVDFFKRYYKTLNRDR
jgi:hypothetical protein